MYIAKIKIHHNYYNVHFVYFHINKLFYIIMGFGAFWEEKNIKALVKEFVNEYDQLTRRFQSCKRDDEEENS